MGKTVLGTESDPMLDRSVVGNFGGRCDRIYLHVD